MTDDYKWRTITFFVSSTFSDMDAERDYINRVIAPRLISDYEKKYIHLKFIDLRWGVQSDSLKSQDEREKEVLKVCFEEIQRSRPYFISLLGARYGWVPDRSRYQELINTLSESDSINMEGQEGVSITNLEIMYGALCNPKYMGHSLFYLRDDASYENMSSNIKEQYVEQQNIDKLNNLKKKIISFGKEQRIKVSSYHLTWEQDHFEGLEEWGETLYNDISREIDVDISSTNEHIPKNWVEAEQQKQDIFRHNICQHFVGYEKEIEEMTRKMITRNGVHVLGGYNLSGKSAFLSRIYNQIATLDPNATILYHATGVSNYSCDTNRMFMMWISKLSNLLGKHYAIPDGQTDNNLSLQKDSNSVHLRSTFLSLCDEFFQKGNTLYLLIDGTEKFISSDEATNYSWLPEKAACLLTTFSGGACKENIANECEITNTVSTTSVSYMRQMKREEAEQLLINYSWKEYHKRFPQSVIKNILEKCVPVNDLNEKELKYYNGPYFGYYNPLWIRLVVHCLASMTIDDYKKTRIEGSKDPQKDIENYMNSFVSEVPANIYSMVRDFMPKKLPFDHRAAIVIMDFLAISYNGLSENDLLTVANGITPLQFSLFRYYYRPILIEDQQSGRWMFLHQMNNGISKSLYDLYFGALAEHFSFKHVNEGYLFPREAVYYNYYLRNKGALALVCISPDPSVMEDVATELSERIMIAKQFEGNDSIPWLVDSFQTLNNHERRCNIAVLSVLVAHKLSDRKLDLTIKWSEAILPLVESTKLTGLSADLCRLLSLSYHRQMNHEKEVYYSKKGLKYGENEANPETTFKAFLNMAISKASEDVDESEKYFEKALFLLDHDLQSHGNNEWHAICKMEIYANLLTLYFQNGIIDEFVDLMPKALSLADLYVQTPSCLYNCSLIYLYIGRYLSEYTEDQHKAIGLINKATAILEKATTNDINSVENQVQLGICYEARGCCFINMDIDTEAIKDFKRQIKQFALVLQKDPDDERTQKYMLVALCHIVELLWDEEYNDDFINSAMDIVNRTINLSITDIDVGYVMKYVGIAYYRLFKLSHEYAGLNHLTSNEWSVFLYQGGLCLFFTAFNDESSDYLINWAWELLYARSSMLINTGEMSIEILSELYQMYDDLKPTDLELQKKVESMIQGLLN